MTADGGFAEYVVHYASSLYKMSNAVTFKDAVLITTAGTGLFGLDTAGGYVIGQDIAIFGAGPVGLMTVQLAKQLGARNVILVDLDQARLNFGKTLGANHVIHSAETDPIQLIREITKGKGVHLAIDTAGAPAIPDSLLRITRRGGKILLIAFYAEPVTLDLAKAVREGIQIQTSRGEGGGDVERALHLAEMGRLCCGELVTHEFPLDQISEALHVLRTHEGGPIKVVLTF